MKFIVHNLRMIWARLSNSGWVLAELFLVFIVMWFLCDSLGCMKYGEFYQFNLSSCIRQQNSLTAQFVSFSLANLANIFYPPDFYNN